MGRMPWCAKCPDARNALVHEMSVRGSGGDTRKPLEGVTRVGEEGVGKEKRVGEQEEAAL